MGRKLPERRDASVSGSTVKWGWNPKRIKSTDQRQLMSDDDDIPVLRDAVARRQPLKLSPEEIDELCADINAAAAELIDKLLAEAMREAEYTLRQQVNERLTDELPMLIEKTLQDKLSESSDN